MADIKLYADEHVPFVVIKILKQNNFDIKTVFEAKKISQPDFEHLEFSIKEGRVIITHDSDFLKLTKEIEHPGIIFVTKQLPVSLEARKILLILNTLSAEDIKNSIQYVG